MVGTAHRADSPHGERFHNEEIQPTWQACAGGDCAFSEACAGGDCAFSGGRRLAKAAVAVKRPAARNVSLSVIIMLSNVTIHRENVCGYKTT
jgi:hypothetical protein